MLRISILLLALGLAMTACGDGDEPSQSAPEKSSAGAFPVEIEHALGTTTIEAEPRRVVVVGYTDQEALLALGVKPVGAMDWFGQGTYAKWPWEREAWGGEPAEIVSSKSYEIDFEKVAAQQPDLILGLYAELKRGDYDKLSQIAPTVAQAKGEAYNTPWRDMTRVAAKAVGRVADGERLIEKVEADFAAFREAHPETKGQTALVVDAGEAPRATTRSPPTTSADSSCGSSDTEARPRSTSSPATASARRCPRSGSTCSTWTGCSC